MVTDAMSDDIEDIKIGGISASEYIRGIKNGNIDPNFDNAVKAILWAADEIERLREIKEEPLLRWCSCKASARDGQHMAWCPAVADAMSDKLPKPETLLAYASILEKPQYWIDPRGRKWLLATGEIIEAACAALRYCAALKPQD